MAKKFRLNIDIRKPRVRLIDENDNHLGIISTEEALNMARGKGLDLVEVSPNMDPSVCRIMDFGKFLYRQKKIEQKHKRMQKKGEIKGVRLSFAISDHDLNFKAVQAKGFLERGDVVKVALIFKGREGSHSDLAKAKMIKFAEILKDSAKIEQEPKKQGNTLMMILLPANKGQNTTQEKDSPSDENLPSNISESSEINKGAQIN